MPHIKIYSTEWCGFCKAEKRFLQAQGLSFEDVNIEADPQQADEMYRLSGQNGVPFTVITADEGTTTHILGYDRPHLVKALGLKP